MREAGLEDRCAGDVPRGDELRLSRLDADEAVGDLLEEADLGDDVLAVVRGDQPDPVRQVGEPPGRRDEASRSESSNCA